jgi:serine/threonine-protein kinase
VAAVIVCPSCRAEYEEAATRFCGRCGSDMRIEPPPSDGMDPMIGRIIDGRYRIVSRLGQGGMGAVYRVEHLAMGKQAAMKVLHPALTTDPEVGKRFRREAAAVSRLSHPNTVQVFDFNAAGSFMYLVMELVKGEDLGQILRRDGPLPFARAKPILMQVCDALTEAHEAGVIHRDLKPENILISRTRDGRDLVKVLDFGLAKLRDNEELNQVTARGSLVGTPFYMSPEQIRGEALDARSDVYSLGALLYRLITGEHPYSGTTPVAVLTQHLTEELRPPSLRRPELRLLPAVDDVIARAMAKRVEDRIPTAEDLKLALSAVEITGELPPPTVEKRRASDATGPQPASPAAGAARREDFDLYERGLRRRRWLGLAVPLVLVAAGAGVVALQRLRPPAAPDEESEPNNAAAEANAIGNAHPLRGHIGQRLSSTSSDHDYFRFTIDGKDNLLKALLTGIPNMDLKLEVYDDVGKKIAETDGGGTGDGEIIPNTRLRPGDYYLAVREVWVLGRPPTENVTDWYQLTAAWHPLAASEESEPDDTPATALPLPLEEPMQGYLGRAGDVDYFYPRGEGGGTLSGQISGIDGVDVRLVVLPAGSTTGPPEPTPVGARVFDDGGAGAPEHFDGVAWPSGSAGPILVVERKDPRPDASGRRVNLVGLDVPYSFTVRLSR